MPVLTQPEDTGDDEEPLHPAKIKVIEKPTEKTVKVFFIFDPFKNEV